MKTLFNYPVSIYLIAGVASMTIMIIIDYILGAEAEHLNAWVIINGLFGIDTDIPDSLAIRQFGLYGATGLMLVINFITGFLLIHVLRSLMQIIHFIF